MRYTKLRFSIRVVNSLVIALALLSAPQWANADHGRGDIGDFGGFPGKSFSEAGVPSGEVYAAWPMVRRRHAMPLVCSRM